MYPQLTVANKAAEAGEKQYGTSSGEAGGPPAPPTYEEATGAGEKGMSVSQKELSFLHSSLLMNKSVKKQLTIYCVCACVELVSRHQRQPLLQWGLS
jgi:hypothetical protein